MISLIIAYWKQIIFLLLLIFIFSWIGISRCNEDKQTLATEQVNTSILRAFLIDSTRTSTLKADNAKLDSMKAVEASKTKQATANAKYWEYIAVQRGKAAIAYKNKADSLSQNAGEECIPFLEAYREANDSLRSENIALDSANLYLNIEAEGYSRQLFLCEQQSSNKDSILASKEIKINQYESQIGKLQCYRNWGLKHRFWKWVFGWECD